MPDESPTPRPDKAEALVERWLRVVPTLAEPTLRVRFIRSDWLAQTPEEAAGAFDEIIGAASQAEPRARDVWVAALPSLLDPDLAAARAQLVDAAEHRALLSVTRVLRAPTSTRTLEGPGVDEREAPIDKSGRRLTLGERRALARRPTRQLLERAIADPHPMVISIVLTNRLVTENDVVLLAAKRPAFPDIQAEIARHPTWIARARVRLALVQNPFTPAFIAMPVLLLLTRPELRGVAEATDLPMAVRGTAHELLLRLPPTARPSRHAMH